MDIKKSLIANGPGSIGDSAETIMKVYKNLKVAYPVLSEKDLYKLTLKARRDHVYNILHNEFALYAQDYFIENDVNTYGIDLNTLIIREIKLEYPILDEIKVNDPILYEEAVAIVKNIVEKYI